VTGTYVLPIQYLPAGQVCIFKAGVAAVDMQYEPEGQGQQSAEEADASW